MKKLFALILAGMLLRASALAETRVFDYAGLLTGSQEETLEAEILALRQEFDFDFALLTTNDSQGKTAWDYGADFYDSGDFGPDGLILTVCMDQRQIEGVGSGAGVDIFPPETLVRMYDRVVDDMSDGDYMEAFEAYISLARRRLARPEGGMSWKEAFEAAAGMWPLALAIGLAVGAITVLVLRARMRTGRRAVGAGDCVKPDSFRLTDSQDLFLYSTFTRVKVESSSGGRGGGGRFTGSSGASHSHGGGRF